MSSQARPIMVEVTSLVDVEDMDYDDIDDHGDPIPPGAYLLTITDAPDGATHDEITDAASYHFHGKIPIACLDDFDIMYRKAAKADLDLPGSYHDLGSFPFCRPDEDLTPEP